MTRFVLVHGAFMGGWCWDLVAAILRGAGHEVSAPDLPGAGADRARIAQTTLGSCVDAVVRVLEATGPAVLVGHSLGGVTVTEAAAACPAAVLGVVHVAAFAPRPGQSAVDLARLPEGTGEGLRARMRVGADGVATLSAADAAEVLFGRCCPEAVRWACERTGPHATWVPQTPVAGAGHPGVPRACVVCARDRAVPPELQRRIARDAGCRPVLEIDTDRSPFLSAPAALAAALLDLAERWRSPSPHDDRVLGGRPRRS